MTVIDSGACRTSSGAGQAAAAQGSNGFRGSPQDRADALVRATVLSDLGQRVGHGRHSHGIQGVAAAIRKVLSAQDVTGTAAADDVLKKIETSLHKAAQKLADRGVDARTIDATIDKFRSQLANALDGTPGTGAGAGTSSGSGATGSDGSSGATSGSGSAGTSGASGTTSGSTTPAPSSTPSVSTFVAGEVRKERGAIDLVTAEGDHVSIRFRTKEVVAGSVTQSTAADGTSTTATKASLFSRGGMKIEVEGDLNADELKAIGDLLGKVDDIATKFFSGDVQAAFTAAGSIGVDSDQIAAYRLNLTYSRKIAAAYGYAGASLPVSTQPPAGNATTPEADSGSAPASAAGAASDSSAASGSSGGAPASTPAFSGGASTSDSGPTDGAPASATDPGTSAGATDGTGTSGTTDTPPAMTAPPSAQKTIIDFISDALSKLNSANGAGRITFTTHWKLNVLVTALQTVQPAQPTTPADQATVNNTQLLGDSLQKIAAA